MPESEAMIDPPDPAVLREECVRCGHHRKMHGQPCGFHSCGCPQFFASECEIALATEREMRAAWEKRAYQAEAELVAARDPAVLREAREEQND